jgi:hypothetical protein
MFFNHLNELQEILYSSVSQKPISVIAEDVSCSNSLIKGPYIGNGWKGIIPVRIGLLWHYHRIQVALEMYPRTDNCKMHVHVGWAAKLQVFLFNYFCIPLYEHDG